MAEPLLDERRWERWGRRLITVPAYIAAAVLLVPALPVLAALACLIDLVRGNTQFVALRCVLALTLYFACEALGVVAAACLWTAHQVWPGKTRERFLDWNYELQRQWARVLFGGAARIFSLRVVVDGADEIGAGPLLLFARHASTIDTLLPAQFVSYGRGLRLRYVMKRELLWDPCLDIVGQRLPNVFVRRGSGDSAREIGFVRRLAQNLGRGEGVLLFPEGTRFTPAKRLRAIDKLSASGATARAQRAQTLQHVLPPRLGGALALLEEQPDADVVFLAHVGFDGVGSLNDLWNGSLVGRYIRLFFWRVPRRDVPLDDDGRTVWLDAQWARIDGWIASLLPSEPADVPVGAVEPQRP